MTALPLIRGRCPGALDPMMSGDGMLVRIRPVLGRLTAAQGLALCQTATTHGAGLIEVTRRANLQLRGVDPGSLPALQAALSAQGLLDSDPVAERRRNILIPPDHSPGDDSHRIGAELISRLAELPEMPAKIGFAIDAGPAPILCADPADFRVERGANGLILRADGRDQAMALPVGGEVDALIRLADWFMRSGGGASGRMARHAADLPVWATGARPVTRRSTIQPGRHPLGFAVGLAFGQADAEALAALIRNSGATALRITPWRVVLLEGVTQAPGDLPSDFITSPDMPALRVDACPGAPFCPQASVATRALALRLAPYIQGGLHVSGCAKGCARTRPAAVVLTGRDGRFDLARNARAGDPPDMTDLSPPDLLHLFRGP